MPADALRTELPSGHPARLTTALLRHAKAADPPANFRDQAAAARKPVGIAWPTGALRH